MLEVVYSTLTCSTLLSLSVSVERRIEVPYGRIGSMHCHSLRRQHLSSFYEDEQLMGYRLLRGNLTASGETDGF